jgi:hypothetical protein
MLPIQPSGHSIQEAPGRGCCRLPASRYSQHIRHSAALALHRSSARDSSCVQRSATDGLRWLANAMDSYVASRTVAGGSESFRHGSERVGFPDVCLSVRLPKMPQRSSGHWPTMSSRQNALLARCASSVHPFGWLPGGRETFVGWLTIGDQALKAFGQCVHRINDCHIKDAQQHRCRVRAPLPDISRQRSSTTSHSTGAAAHRASATHGLNNRPASAINWPTKSS